jgi:hypothetical protein
VVLARIIICPPKFKIFNKYVITNYKIEQNNLLIIGDFLILKGYCLILNRAEAVYRRYKAYYATKYLYLINV